MNEVDWYVVKTGKNHENLPLLRNVTVNYERPFMKTKSKTKQLGL
jgi:hypothetical protein